MTSAYTFGHSASAAERLRILADVYEAESAAFLRDHAPGAPAHAVDLGCGPGYTTALIARTTGAAKTTGLDISPEFIAQANSERGTIASFIVHDVTAPPFPGAPPDLIFVRLLVTHLPDPAMAIARWLAALAPGGHLLLDEVDAIDVSEPTCKRYLEITAQVVGTTGGDLYIGPRLASLAPATATVRLDQSLPYPVTAGSAASMFRLNIPNWAGKAIAAGITTAGELSTIATRLDALAEGTATGPNLTWHMRHVVLRPPP